MVDTSMQGDKIKLEKQIIKKKKIKNCILKY